MGESGAVLHVPLREDAVVVLELLGVELVRGPHLLQLLLESLLSVGLGTRKNGESCAFPPVASCTCTSRTKYLRLRLSRSNTVVVGGGGEG